MRKKSLYAFSLLEGLQYEKLSETLDEFVRENPPSNEDETEGFIKFEQITESEILNSQGGYKIPEHIYFEFYRAYTQEKPDPLGIGTYKVPIKEAIPIVVTKSPFMLLIFTSKPTLRDKILEKLPIEPRYRSELTFSSDFIEFINVPKPEDWIEIIFRDEIEPRGRKGRKGDSHEITERYPGPEEREVDLEKKGYVFREFAEVLVSLEEVSVRLTIYPGGKITAFMPGVDLKLSAPYIAEALKVLKDAENRYYKLKKSTQGGEVNGENAS